MSSLSPFEGKKFQPSGSPDIYFVFLGEAHWIPTMDVYRNFWDNVSFDPAPALPVPSIMIPTVPPIPIGFDFGTKACLVRNSDNGAIYVFDGVRAWRVPNMETFGFYNFTLSHFVSPSGGGIDWGIVLDLGIETIASL